MTDIRVIVHDDAIRRLAKSSDLRRLIEDALQPNLQAARRRAPKRTGYGAASISIDTVLDQTWELRISWSQNRYYMMFHELGTKHMPARPFLVPAFRGV